MNDQEQHIPVAIPYRSLNDTCDGKRPAADSLNQIGQATIEELDLVSLRPHACITQSDGVGTYVSKSIFRGDIRAVSLGRVLARSRRGG